MTKSTKRYRFTATIEPVSGGGACVFFPFDVHAEFGTHGRVAVHATFDGVTYTGSMIKYGQPMHMLPMLKGIREQVGKQIGDQIDVVIWRDESERVLLIPDAFAKRMQQEAVLPFFESLSYTHRKEYIRWITEAKKEETRVRRFEKAIEMLKDRIKTPG